MTATDPAALLTQLRAEITAHKGYTRDPADFPTGKILLDLPPESRPAAIHAALDCLVNVPESIRSTFSKVIAGLTFQTVSLPDLTTQNILSKLIAKLLRVKLPLPESDLQRILALAVRSQFPSDFFSINIALRTAEQFTEDHPLTEPTRAALQKIRQLIDDHTANPMYSNKKEYDDFRSRIAILRSEATVASANTPKPFDAAEPWAAAAQRDIESLPPDSRTKFNALLFHLQSAEGAKPSQKWLNETKPLLDSFGKPHFKQFLTTWFPLTPASRSDLPYTPQQMVPDPNHLFSASSAITLKGFAWAASLYDDPDISASLGDLGETCWKKIPNHGPRSKLVGNAVLWSLSAIASDHSVAQLTRINSKLKHASARKLADKAMDRVAESKGQTRDDLEELSLPTFNLDANGSFARTIADFTCTITLTSDYEAALTITDAENKIRKTIPADLKTNPDFKSLQKSLKDLSAILPAQRLRIESLLRNPDRSWSFADWKTRYLDHPLIAPLARRLIWQFTDTTQTFTAIPHNNQLLQSDGTPLITDYQLLITKLYHPCTDTPDNVRAWRASLLRHEITQPFKQAHREIYLLTDAERTTRTYSNRFAAHIIRQHQFAALCAARGWKYKLQGAWDGHNIPTLELPNHHLKVEYWVNQIDTTENNLNANFVSILLSTDQVCFLNPELLPLDQIHPQLFSEILRDVDLFVGVCSVGNDPTWNDGGPDGRYMAYWRQVSFGDLSATAETRKEILTTLLPRLAIAPVASLDEKFLIIKGHLRTYKIHLGSTNILMEPNDHYLCIVPGRSTSTVPQKIYLPFEGDHSLAVILSKAFLLANDQKITDETILRQIKK